jgi:hypothetical protein
MDLLLDERGGHEEVVTECEPPTRKGWETVERRGSS